MMAVFTQGFTLSVDGIAIAGEAYIPEAGKCHPALIICHGIPAGIPDPSDPGYPALAEKFGTAGFATFIFSFRGTGLSGGDFDILGWARDLEAAISYALSLHEVDPNRLALMGFSGGAAVSVFVAAQDTRVSAVVALACPAQFTAERFPFLLEQSHRIGIIRHPDFPPSPEEWWQGFEHISPIHWIDKISPRPLYLIHGEKDELIAIEQAHSLYGEAGEPKELAIIPGAGHRLRHEKKAMALALDWLKKWAGI